MSSTKDKFTKYFKKTPYKDFTVYGRAELGGNHTDHQKGLVLAASINKAMIASAAPNGTDTVNIFSEGFGLTKVTLNKLYPLNSEKGTTAALVRGMAARYKLVNGFDAYISSDIPEGAGLSSSAAFEILIGRIIEGLFDKKTDDTTISVNAQYAENVFFDKPCGLMDQMACAYGGIVKINFKNPEPIVERINYDFNSKGYTLCIIDSGTSHEELTSYYAEIPSELARVSNYFYQDTISQIDSEKFNEQLAEIRKYAGDRAVLRAMHVFNENFRVCDMANALKEDDIERYLDLVNKSGDSSWMLLQNVIPSGEIEHQGLAFAITAARLYLKGRGACRVMGGGFAGNIQAYVPSEMLTQFTLSMERAIGKNCVTPVKITHY